jgi:hypothetical protein
LQGAELDLRSVTRARQIQIMAAAPGDDALSVTVS